MWKIIASEIIEILVKERLTHCSEEVLVKVPGRQTFGLFFFEQNLLKQASFVKQPLHIRKQYSRLGLTSETERIYILKENKYFLAF